MAGTAYVLEVHHFSLTIFPMRKGDFNLCSLRAGRKEREGEGTSVAVQ